MDGAGAALTPVPAAARRAAIVAGSLLVALLCSAHVGSPDTFFEGFAGPYPVRVIIRSPTVIPARAEIVVRARGSGVKRVTATTQLWNGGEHGAPPADDAARVAGDSTLWTLQLWIMRQGSYAVIVHVDGAAGPGTAIIPYTAVATGVLRMNRGMAVALSALAVFLVAGLITIVGAASREATLEPGAEPDAATWRRSWRVRGVAAAILIIALGGGRIWWLTEDRAYAAAVFKSAAASVTTRVQGKARILRFAVDTAEARSRNWVPFVPDHGKLMHLFLVKAGDMGAMAHLHPVAVDSLTFDTALPLLPAGRYYVFADVVHENGFAETMVQSVMLDAPAGKWTPSDPDDAWFIGAGVGTPARFDDGSMLSWDGALTPHIAGADANLHFTLHDARGAPLTVEPYMGMAAHAVIVRDSGTVYVHLHPIGTTSTAAEEALRAWTPEDSARGAIRAKMEREQGAMRGMAGVMPGELSFPYAFPRAGHYRVWVQFRREGKIRTAAFDVMVAR
jgi:hypothetical protein